VRVNGIAPGPIETPMLDRLTERKTEVIQRVALRRTGTPEEAAEAVVFMRRGGAGRGMAGDDG
jgi:NAD(P)-dependent dehydrogenase (short-subunit alcohol dehydrogenase family)